LFLGTAAAEAETSWMQNLASCDALLTPEASVSDLRTRITDVGERIILLAAIAFSVSANIASDRTLNLASVANDLIVVFFVLMRRRAKLVSPHPFDWAVAFGACLGVLLMRPGGTPLIGAGPALALAVPAWLISLSATFSLNRGFGVVAANRGIHVRGAYALVRHPMYLGYFLNHTTYLLLNPTVANLGVWLVVCGCQVGRVVREEQLLRQDPAYRAYCARVRFLFVPALV
jgi:protein-S-isoprenylcysteine O-methyltransferase Ste14